MAPAAAPLRLRDDDVPAPATRQVVSNRLLAAAAPVLVLVAGVRTGRARIAIPDLHRQVSAGIAEFERAVLPDFPDETRMRAKYALCATVDDIVQNLPGIGADGAEWARRSMVVTFFQENIGGDRFWQLTRDMVARPAQNAELIEFFHACLATGFEGKYRVMPNGARGLYDEMNALYGALEHPRSVSTVEIVDRWRGEQAPMRKVGLWSHVLLAAAVAAVALLLIYIVLRLMLLSSGAAPSDAVTALNPAEPLRLSRTAAPPPAPPPSDVYTRVSSFLDKEQKDGLVKVEQDATSVRVRTTIGTLFQSGSDVLEPGKAALFEAIGRSVDKEKGAVTVEGHADSDRVASLASRTTSAFRTARADTVAAVLKGVMADGGRVTAKGFGDTRPIASNDNAEGKAENRRVEIVIPRTN